jgi:hypothetical protein
VAIRCRSQIAKRRTRSSAALAAFDCSASHVQNSSIPKVRCIRLAAATCKKSALPAANSSARRLLYSSADSSTASHFRSGCHRRRACVRSALRSALQATSPKEFTRVCLRLCRSSYRTNDQYTKSGENLRTASDSSPENSSLGWKKANRADVSAYTSGITASFSFPQDGVRLPRPRRLLSFPNFRHDLLPFRIDSLGCWNEESVGASLAQDAEPLALSCAVQKLSRLFMEHLRCYIRHILQIDTSQVSPSSLLNSIQMAQYHKDYIQILSQRCNCAR